MIKQRTIKNTVSVKGIGLHTGKVVTLTFKPLPSNSGIVYRRTDLIPNVDFFPSPQTVIGTQLCTQIFSNDKKYFINTVEHLNAAIAACGIDNLLIELDNIEVPILDGSSIAFIYLLKEAEIELLNANKEFLLTKKSLEIKGNDDKYVQIKPYYGLHIDFTIQFNHPFIKNSKNNWKGEITTKTFINEIARARTFGFLKDIEFLQSKGMCLGGSLDNAMVLDEFKLLNPEGLRFEDEFVRHKVLDSVGDLFVVGKNILTSFTAFKSGHELNNIALQEIIKPENSEILVVKDRNEINNIFKFDFKFEEAINPTLNLA